MIISASVNTNKNEIMSDKYIDILQQGALVEQILVVLLNPYKKTLFLDNLLKRKINDIEKAKIYTLNGLYYNAFKDNEMFVKTLLKCSEEEILTQCGLEVSQYIFKQSIKEADFSDYISKVNLLHQLFRRYALIVQNALTEQEINHRSEILGEVFAKDAAKAIFDYKQKTIEYRSFDYLRQTATFPLIYKNTKYFSEIKYVIVDDADEMPYIFWQFIDYIMPQIKDYMIAYDDKGSSRCGYLCAYKSGITDFKEKFKPKELLLKDKSIYSDFADSFFEAIKKSKKIKVNNIAHKTAVNRLDMLDCIFADIKELISNGVKPHEIAVITPLSFDFVKKYAFSFGFNFQSISGSEKLSDVNGIKQIISILKIVNGIDIEEYEIKSLLINLLEIPYKKCYQLINCFKKLDFQDFFFENELYNEKYKKFQSVVKSLKNTKYTLSEQIQIIYENLLKKYILSENISKYEFLLKEAQIFERAFFGKIENFSKEFIVQIENSIISENPIDTFSVKDNEIIISSPQKLVDFSIKTKYQFWIDISSSQWVQQDTGMLYNAWVLNRDWKGKEYTLEDNIKFTKDKTARLIRKLMLCAQQELRFYSSVYDSAGNENFGGLTDFLCFEQDNKTVFQIVPREDQKPVLDYNGGKSGIMAVPGAGKTTILLALIIKLIKTGISPENIFVITYMESAAKNFKERIKSALPNGAELPNISTIHGLALRIIKENGNYSNVGLDENFEICDDREKEKIIKEIFYKLKISDEKYDNYLRCISVVKLAKNNTELNSKYQDIQDFYDFLNEYNKALKQKNLIDYDDMLRYSLQILNTNKDIRDYYQNLCRYIIEDEAQDSTEIQQVLIDILSKKYNNILRCGDINQSITSTFTNSNLNSFRDFILRNKKIEMVSSQRCAESIYSLANKLVDMACKDENKNKAFYKIAMQGTDKNPKTDSVPYYNIFESEKEEKEFILNKIREIQNKSSKASIAILLRLNAQVNKYNEYMLANGIKTSVRADCLFQKNIYKYIYSVLNIIKNPSNNHAIAALGNLYCREKREENKFISDFFDNLKLPFINVNADELSSELLSQLYWDVDYWLNNADKSIEELAFNIGLYYSKNSVDKSNTYLISTFIRKLRENNDNADVLKLLDYYSQKPLSTYKFFEEDDYTDTGSVNIMTVHKSKGDEFDYVFIPQLNEDSYAIDKENIKLKSGSHFVETIKNSVNKDGVKSPDELKQEQMEETLRLLYVGITRAKRGLFLSSAKHYLIRKNVKISKFIDCFFSESLIKYNCR